MIFSLRIPIRDRQYIATRPLGSRETGQQGNSALGAVCMNDDVYGKVLRAQSGDVAGEGARSRFSIRPANP